MTGEELAEAKRYGRYDLACTLADKGLDVAYLAVAAFWLALPMDAWLKDCSFLPDYRWARLPVLFLIVTVGHICVSMPLSFYSGYLLEHRFGLSRLTVGGWFWRYVKRMLLALGFAALMMMGLYALIWYTGSLWWLLAGPAFFVVSVGMGRLLPVLILPLFYTIEKLDAPELAERIGRLAEEAGLSIEGVYRMALSEETVKANAMLAGLGRTRRVLLGDTLLDGFSPEEIAVIFAHEIGHHVYRHIRKRIVVLLLFSIAGFMICDALLTGQLPFTATAVQYAQIPVHTLPLVMLILTLFEMFLEPLGNALDRRYERQADRYALRRTGSKAAYVSAFRKLAKLNKDDPDPHPLDVLLFHGHPPIAQRLAMADE